MARTVKFDSNHFEIAFTALSVALFGYWGTQNFPEGVPLSLVQFVLLVALLGFAFGFGVSTYIVARYKAFKKRLAK